MLLTNTPAPDEEIADTSGPVTDGAAGSALGEAKSATIDEQGNIVEGGGVSDSTIADPNEPIHSDTPVEVNPDSGEVNVTDDGVVEIAEVTSEELPDATFLNENGELVTVTGQTVDADFWDVFNSLWTEPAALLFGVIWGVFFAALAVLLYIGVQRRLGNQASTTPATPALGKAAMDKPGIRTREEIITGAIDIPKTDTPVKASDKTKS